MTVSPTPFRRLLVCTECGQTGTGSPARGSAGPDEAVAKLPALAFYCYPCASAELAVEPRPRSL